MKKMKLFTSIFILWSFTISFFSLNLTNKTTSEESFDIDWQKVMPLDFFGDYSHGDIYEVEYIYPGDSYYSYFYLSIDYLQSLLLQIPDLSQINLNNEQIQKMDIHWEIFNPEYEGRGIVPFWEYTSAYNNALVGEDKIDGTEDDYHGYYEENYREDAIKNLDGFKYLSPNLKALNAVYYINDWTIWHYNEVVYPDLDDIGNSEVFISMIPSREENRKDVYYISDLEMEENKNKLFNEFAGVRTDKWVQDIDNDWSATSFIFDVFPKIYYEEYYSFSNDYFYYLDPFLTFNGEKQNIESNFDIDDQHNIQEWINLKIYNETKFSLFKNEFEEKLLYLINDQFLEQKYLPELNHDRTQGIYPIEDIRIEDLNITYNGYGDNGWVVIEDDYDGRVGNFKEIKIEINSKEESLTSEGSIVVELDTSNLKSMFEPPITPVDPIPENNEPPEYLGLIYGLSVVIGIILIIIIVFLSFKFIRKEKR